MLLTATLTEEMSFQALPEEIPFKDGNAVMEDSSVTKVPSTCPCLWPRTDVIKLQEQPGLAPT